MRVHQEDAEQGERGEEEEVSTVESHGHLGWFVNGGRGVAADARLTVFGRRGMFLRAGTNCAPLVSLNQDDEGGVVLLELRGVLRQNPAGE